jgi:hypothetical protein
MTECTQETFGFAAHFSRRVQSEFTAGRVSSDGGALLLRGPTAGSTFWAGWSVRLPGWSEVTEKVSRLLPC